MRIKTTSKVALKLDDIQKSLHFKTKAEVLKLAINLAINSENKEVEELLEDGFEVDTSIIFEKEHDYYDYIIKEYYQIESLEKKYYLNLIEYGILLLENEIKRSKNNKEILIENLINKIKE